MSKLRSYLTLLLACSAVAAGAALGSASGATVRISQVSTPASTGASVSIATSRQVADRVDEAVRAITTAEQRIARSKAYDIESDSYRGRRVWEVKVARGVTRPYEFDVRADGRRVVRQAPRPRLDNDVRALASVRIALARALRIAARHAQGGRFDEAEIDRSGGRVAWDVTFEGSGNREIEVEVDARTGKVLSVDVGD